jgi:hypothetical protein
MGGGAIFWFELPRHADTLERSLPGPDLPQPR